MVIIDRDMRARTITKQTVLDLIPDGYLKYVRFSSLVS